MTFVLVLLVSNSGRMHCGLVNQARLVQSWCCPVYCMACLLLIPVSDVAQTHLFTPALLQCTSIWSTHTSHMSRLHVRTCNQVCPCCVITLPISELFDSFSVCCQEVSVRLFRARPVALSYPGPRQLTQHLLQTKRLNLDRHFITPVCLVLRLHHSHQACLY